jgi:hypothetical protein
MRCAAFMFVILTVMAIGDLQAGQAVPAKENPFVGHWTANLSKSKLHPTFQFRSVTLEIAVAGDTVTMASGLVNATGQEQHAAETFRTDGTETPGTLSSGVVLVARWVGSHVLATKDGQVVALVTYEVSPDGKTLTSRSSGVIEQVIVFARAARRSTRAWRQASYRRATGSPARMSVE